MPNDVDAGLHDVAAVETAVAFEFDPSPNGFPPAPGSGLAATTAEPLPEAKVASVGPGQVAWISARSPFKAGPNEDALATIPLTGDRGMLLVADGLGGHRGGRQASQLLRSLLIKAARRLVLPPKPLVISKVVPLPDSGSTRRQQETGDPRTLILDEIERTNQRLLRSRAGSATTLALVEIKGQKIRTYHIGDSEIIVVSQRGRIKFSTVSHSPIGYAVESGMLTEEQALFHPDRHLVSNVVGSEQMSVELGPWIPLSARDTVLLASDGLFDNLMQHEIVECIRKGKLADSVRELAGLARQRMLQPDLDAPSKPDDLTILVYRSR